MHDFIWLASQSPRRRELLEQIGVAWRLLLPDTHADAQTLHALEALEEPLRGEAPAAYVQRVTLLKLEAARVRLRERAGEAAPILCADTTVALGRRILGKPADAREAAATLAALSGRTHRVLTAVALWTGRRTLQALSVSRVHVAPLTPAQIRAYIASGEPFGKAGAYGIQGAFASCIHHIAGSHSGIVGLPLHETAQLLRAARVRTRL
ncbi:MAG: septum formation inhibitor Maf [Pseudomonadota bacterium]|jgi:septum formation protein